jgi:hypothetical protein
VEVRQQAGDKIIFSISEMDQRPITTTRSIVFAALIASALFVCPRADSGSVSGVDTAGRTVVDAPSSTDQQAGAPYLDELSQPKPWYHINTAARNVRMGFRAFTHSLRDLFFPDFRLQSTALKVSTNSIDKMQPGENPEDYAKRLEIRNWMIGKADEFGLPELYARHPTTFRYSVAIVLGLILMAFFFVFQQMVNIVVKACMRVLLRATGHELFVDETSESELALLERLQEEAEKRRLQAESKTTKKDDDHGANKAAEPAGAGENKRSGASASASASGVRRRKEA